MKRLSEKEVSCLGLDISKPAIVAAAKRSKNITWVVGTNKALPVEEYSIDIVFCMFGFCDLAILSRILKPEGVVILVDPGHDHLLELRKVLYPHIKNSKPKDNPSEFCLVKDDSVRYKLELDQGQISDLLLMTPHLYRASKEGKELAMNLKAIELTVDVEFRILQKKST